MRYMLLAKISAYGAKKYLERLRRSKETTNWLGIKVEAIYYTQGEYELIEAIEAPNAEAVLALSTWFNKAGYGTISAMPCYDVAAMKRADKKAGR